MSRRVTQTFAEPARLTLRTGAVAHSEGSAGGWRAVWAPLPLPRYHRPTIGVHKRESSDCGAILDTDRSCPRPPQSSGSPLQCVIRCALRVNFQRQVLNSSLTGVDTWAYERSAPYASHSGYSRTHPGSPSEPATADAASGADRHSAHRATFFIRPASRESSSRPSHAPHQRAWG
jgi:hypothetical protein